MRNVQRFTSRIQNAASRLLLGVFLIFSIQLLIPSEGFAQQQNNTVDSTQSTALASTQDSSATGNMAQQTMSQTPTSPGSGQGLVLQVVITGILGSLVFWMVARPQPINKISTPGFEVVTPSEKRRFIPLTEKYHQMDFLTDIKTEGQLRLSANLNRVGLSMRSYGYLLEDKNYRNALLVNRRRVRRTPLKDGDILDLGDLTLLYRDNRAAPLERSSGANRQDGKVHVGMERLRGPVRKGTPVLVMEQPQNKSFYITKNMVYIGRSESNDLVVKAEGVAYKHVKIERVGSRLKLTDLASSGNTFVNNRRVEQRVLKEGDEVALEAVKFKFQLANAPVRESNYAKPKILSSAEVAADSFDDQDNDTEQTAEETA